LITSDPGPDPDLYKADLAEAIGSGQPVAVAFSTPAFCKSATCGPQVDVLSELEDEYGAQAHFIHVEIFDNPAEVLQSGDLSIARESPLVEAWGLPSEPWTFVINGDGKVVAKFEGFATRAELEEALQDVLGI
jgi:thiol-disulfide isomerase/thioredoxin